MATIHVNLPGDLQQFVEGRVTAGSFGSESEYIVALLESAKRGQSALEAQLLEGLASGEAEPWTESDFQSMRNRLKQQHGAS